MVCGFSSAGTFAYITSAPFVFIVLYKVPTERFGWLFGSVAAGMVAASQINGRMSHRIPLWRVLRTANTVQLFAGMLLLASVYAAFGALPALRNAFYGIGPVVVGIFAVAIYRLAKGTIKDRLQIPIAVSAVGLVFAFIGMAKTTSLRNECQS